MFDKLTHMTKKAAEKEVGVIANTKITVKEAKKVCEHFDQDYKDGCIADLKGADDLNVKKGFTYKQAIDYHARDRTKKQG